MPNSTRPLLSTSRGATRSAMANGLLLVIRITARPRRMWLRCWAPCAAGLDVRRLRCFQGVAEFGRYSRGAEFLRISQPAVSRQIRGLEEELGRPLFIRHSHGVSLTEAGRVLLERTQSILRQFDQARDEIRRGL